MNSRDKGKRGERELAAILKEYGYNEAAERAAALRTQGRKGCKATRINMAFTPDNHEFIKVMARITGKTMTEFANYCIEQYRNEHPELYEQAKQIIDSL